MIERIFLHIPRCGGTSIKRLMNEHLGPFGKFPAIHKPAGQVPPKPDQKFFTFKRNPFDRAVSLCAYALKYRDGRPDQKEGDLPIEVFEEWVYCGDRDWYTVSQVQFLEQYMAQIEFIGRFENLEADFLTYIWKHYPQYGIKRLPKVNDSNHANYKTYYRRADVFARILEEYSDDAHFLGYPTEREHYVISH